MPTKEERNWALLAHLSPIVLTLVSGGLVPFLGPLVIWLVKRDESEFVGDQAREALNFQITVAIANGIAWLLVLGCIGWLVLPALWVAEIALCVLASVRASEGTRYRYPLALRLVD